MEEQLKWNGENPYEPMKIINRKPKVSLSKLPIVSPYDVAGQARMRRSIKLRP